LLVGFLFIIFAATFDILDSLIWNTGIGISKYTFFIFIVFIIFILANKLIELQIKTEELNANLEKKVEERTRALAESLQRVQELKVQQDGDYFLTSLLISPLGKSQIDSETIKIDSFLKQKKQFEFRKRTYEIGGDLCIAHRIRLQNESYIIFVNSDAMGKSIQGAGGAIVLGSLFQSIIERTRSSSLLQNQAPEIWLKSTFIELHKIFESFDGSMLVSLVIGLVDESNGFVYYMNAEHPWLVLYRDGKASYMENDLDFRKLGFISSTNSNLFVKTFQMQVGDKIITGSDGRDDILITDNNGRKYMNENQDFFLRHVEKSNGVLKGIFQSIKQSGEIYDDLSLLSLEYLGNASEQLPKANSKQIEDAIQHYHNKDYTGAISILSEVKKEFGLNQEGLKTLVYSYEQLRSHNLAAITTSFYLKKFPGDNEMLFFASREYFLASDILSAAQYAERLKLREPENIENLIQLIEIYITSKNYLRSMKLIEKLAKLQPEHSKIKAFQKELNELLPN
ncbi:MAG: serine/threonine-protein phosphatase, partial [Leptospiraceae bacterium]|nr:serine/threonine-protein phosphatase [Leptospiraceae bacterium]